MTTAEIALIVSGVAAAGSVGTALATYKLGVRRFAHERELADTADARSILAEAAMQLGRMKGTLKNALTVFQRPLETGEDWQSRVALELAAAADRVREIKTRYVQAWRRDARRPRKEPEIDFEFVWEKSLDFDARIVGYLEAAEQAVGVKLGAAK